MDLSTTPAAAPPPGVTANFIDPPDAKGRVYSTSIGLCAAGTVILLLRLYTRGFLLRSIGLDDYTCIIGQLFAWLFCILSIFNTQHGYGIHIWDLYVSQVVEFKKFDLAEENIYSVGTFFVKISILIFYCRLNPDKRFRQFAYGIMVFVALYTLISVLVFTFMCIPVYAQWDIYITDAKCINQLDFIYANAACNILSDFATIVLPINLCWKLQTTTKQKILLLIVFVAGSFACVVAIIRIVTMLPFTSSDDATWYKVTVAGWCMVEINVQIICACLPTMRPLLTRSFPKLFETSDAESQGVSSYALHGRSGKSGMKRSLQGSTPDKGFRGWDSVHRTAVGGDSDTESAKGIVKADDTIVKSTGYTVGYETNADNES